MAGSWAEKDILITVKTYPEYSQKYTETMCTGGILAESKKLIRLYPLRYRYLEGKYQFSKYQWIRARIREATSDNRPESYNISQDSITLGEIVGTQDGWQERERYVLSAENVYDSMEALGRARESLNVSLGLIKPREVVDFHIVSKSSSEMEEASLKKDAIMKQLGMFEDNKELDLLPVKFVLHFNCDDNRCNGHKISILDWEIAQLYRKLIRSQDWKIKLKEKVLNEICAESRETYFFMGNMAQHQHIFCVLGFFYPPKVRQRRLF
jgi:hypothetical protein